MQVVKYQPYLFGISHHRPFLRSVLASILRVRPKTVGIEASNDLVWSEAEPFWGPLKAHLEKRGIKVEFLLPDSYDRRLNDLVFPASSSAFSLMADFADPGRKINAAMNEETINGTLSELVSFTLPKLMIKRAIQKKPDVIVCGALHAPILRTNLKIPKEKFRIISTVEPRVLQKEIRRVRRFERVRQKRLPRV